MNLGQFLSYRDVCPFCSCTLKTVLHSQRNQVVKYEDNRLIVFFILKAIKKHQTDYKVGISFGLNDSSWYVEFYTKDDKRFENESPLFLRERFKELDLNLKRYVFYRICANVECNRYSCSSNQFTLNYAKGNIDDLVINVEQFGLRAPPDANGKYSVCKLYNYYNTNTSSFSYTKEDSDVWARTDSGYANQAFIQVPSIIKFTTPEETLDRIAKLMVFS